jgi:hypothetical protein
MRQTGLYQIIIFVQTILEIGWSNEIFISHRPFHNSVNSFRQIIPLFLFIPKIRRLIRLKLFWQYFSGRTIYNVRHTYYSSRWDFAGDKTILGFFRVRLILSEFAGDASAHIPIRLYQSFWLSLNIFIYICQTFYERLNLVANFWDQIIKKQIIF